MGVLEIHVFKSSFKPILELLNESKVNWGVKQYRTGEVVASSGIIEVALNAGVWVSVAAVLRAFISAQHGRKIMITTKDNTVLDIENLTQKELENILEKTEWLAAIDTDKKDSTTH